MTDAPERIWADCQIEYEGNRNNYHHSWDDDGPRELFHEEWCIAPTEYIRADLACAQAGALLRQAADAILLGDTVQNLQRRILAIDPDAQAALDRYVLSDPRVKALVKALELIESLTVHSGGEIHGVTAAHWKTAFLMARDEAEAALAALRAIGGE